MIPHVCDIGPARPFQPGASGHGGKARYSIGLKFRLAPSFMPLGHREVMVLVRV